MKQIILLIMVVFITSCNPKIKIFGNQSISIFNNVNLYFDEGLIKDTMRLHTDYLRLDAGRVLLKKVQLPNYQKHADVKLSVSLASNGDPWDKAGSIFIIPKSADFNILDIEEGVIKEADFKDSLIGVKNTVINGKTYKPAIELMRFMTPFGVGFFNENKKIKELKPVYIPKWEKEVVWEQDLTHLLALLEDEVYIGVFIDTWSNLGYNISVTLDFKESKIPNHIKTPPAVVPIINTTKYTSNQHFFDDFSRKDLRVDFEMKTSYETAKLYYIATGHGGHAEGDEFTKKENVIRLNDTIIKQFIPWRDDCASYRRFNPTSGVWTEKTTWNGEEIEERIASSDYSRSNWCPGSIVLPEIINLNGLSRGTHQLEFSIPEAQPIDGDMINYWMVSAYLVYDVEKN